MLVLQVILFYIFLNPFRVVSRIGEYNIMSRIAEVFYSVASSCLRNDATQSIGPVYLEIHATATVAIACAGAWKVKQKANVSFITPRHLRQ